MKPAAMFCIIKETKKNIVRLKTKQKQYYPKCIMYVKYYNLEQIWHNILYENIEFRSCMYC